MSVTFTADTGEQGPQVKEACLCAQFAPNWIDLVNGDSDDWDSLKDHADPDCRCDAGVLLERQDVRPSMNLANANARALLGALGFDADDLCGECTIAEARRAIMRARNTDVDRFVRAGEVIHGRPRTDSSGVVQLRPVRAISFGLDRDGLDDRIGRFADMVEEGARKGAESIFWG